MLRWPILLIFQMLTQKELESPDFRWAHIFLYGPQQKY